MIKLETTDAVLMQSIASIPHTCQWFRLTCVRATILLLVSRQNSSSKMVMESPSNRRYKSWWYTYAINATDSLDKAAPFAISGGPSIGASCRDRALVCATHPRIHSYPKTCEQNGSVQLKNQARSDPNHKRTHHKVAEPTYIIAKIAPPDVCEVLSSVVV